MNSLVNNLAFKRGIRNIWSGFYNMRYLGGVQQSSSGANIFSNSINQWKNPLYPLINRESKFAELFEAASKSKYISASIIAVDISEVTQLDSYREGYPFTVYNIIYTHNRLHMLNSINY